MSTGQPPLRGTEARGARQEELTGSALPRPAMLREGTGRKGPYVPHQGGLWGGVEEQGSGTLPGQTKCDGRLPRQGFLLHYPLTCWQELPEPVRELTAKVALQDQG